MTKDLTHRKHVGRAGGMTEEERLAHQRDEITGTTYWHYNKGEEGAHVCCDNEHVYGYSLDLDLSKELGAILSPHRDIQGWIELSVRQFPEGAKLKITVEAIDER